MIDSEELSRQDPNTLGVDGEAESKLTFRCLAALRGRGLNQGRLLLIAPPGHPFSSQAPAQGFAIGAHVSTQEIENGLNLGEGFDAAVVLHPLKGATAPVQLLQQVHAALRQDGLLLLLAPSLDAWPGHLFRDRRIEPPKNQGYFSRQDIQSVLLRGGFAQIEIEPDRELHMPGKLLGRRLRVARGIISRLAPPPLRDLGLRLLSTGMVVTAKRVERRERPVCSIILPVYNERQTFPILMDSLLAKRVPGVDREIIVIESNSKDGTREAVLRYQDHPDVRIVLQQHPRGKGNAVRAGLERAEGDIVMIQDADLEYDLDDYESLLEPLLAYRAAFVLGARHGGEWRMRQFAGQPGLSVLANVAHVFFTTLINLLYGQRMRDPLTMFKVFHRECLHGLQFECNRFDFDHELVIKLIRKGYKPLEIPVSYASRSFREGKKIRMLRDPWTWLWADLKYRFVRLYHRRQIS